MAKEGKTKMCRISSYPKLEIQAGFFNDLPAPNNPPVEAGAGAPNNPPDVDEGALPNKLVVGAGAGAPNNPVDAVE